MESIGIQNCLGQECFTLHNHTDLDAVFDIENSIEITLEGSVHDDGVDIALFLSQPLTPATSSSIDRVRSKYEIGGNGFHDGLFLSGSISPTLLPGDVNLDGCVDDLDLTALAVHWQEATDLWEHGDFDGDGTVDDLDLTALAAKWQQGCGDGGSFADAWTAAQVNVPEPVTLSLLLSGGLSVIRRGARKSTKAANSPGTGTRMRPPSNVPAATGLP